MVCGERRAGILCRTNRLDCGARLGTSYAYRIYPRMTGTPRGDDDSADAPPMQASRDQKTTLVSILALAAYAVLIYWHVSWSWDQINPDGISYLRNAQYIARGRFYDSISSYWSPMLSWSIAPLVYFSVDGLHAARIALALWGGVLIIATHQLMRASMPTPGWARMLTLTLVATSTARVATERIVPDLPMAALLLLYCSAVVSEKLLTDRRTQVIAGLAAGGAYLAKSYALPFFFAHFLFSVIAVAVSDRRDIFGRQVVRAWATGAVAFLVVAGPWVGALTYKYRAPMVAGNATIAHTIIGPPDKPRLHPLWELREVQAGRVNIWETPEALAYNHWSPFENRSYFLHQVRHAVSTARQIAEDMSSYDILRSTLPSLVFLPLMLSVPGWRAARSVALRIGAAVVIFAGGFVFVYYEHRYLTALLWPLCCAFSIGVATCWLPRLARDYGIPRRATLLITALLVSSFVLAEGYRFGTFAAEGNTSPGSPFRRIADEIRSIGPHGPIAAMSAVSRYGMYVAFHLDERFFGCPTPAEVADIERELAALGVRTLLVSSYDPMSQDFRERTTWTMAWQTPVERGTLYGYVAPPS